VTKSVTGAVKRATWIGIALSLALGGALAFAQEVDPRRPRTFATGAPSGAAVEARVDAQRTGRAEEPLPRGPLRVGWRKNLSVTIEHPPLVRPDGVVIVVTARGDVHFLNGTDDREMPRDAEREIAHVATGEAPASAPVLLSSGRVAYLSGSGHAVVAAQDRLIAVTPVVKDRPTRVAALALADGGFVAAAAGELVVMDGEGNVRHRAALPIAPTGALLSSGRDILVVGVEGTVFAWTPGDEPRRVGAFDGSVDGNAALGPGGLLYAVVRGNRLIELDTVHGGTSSRAVAATGLFLGPPALRNGGISLFSYGPTSTAIVTIAPDGREVSRSQVATRTAATLPDGGAAALVSPAHTGPVVDDAGAIAFATPEGAVGVVAPDGSVDTLGETACGSSVGRRGTAQLSPAGRGSFVLACETGTVVKVVGAPAK
jgi:hypothetical protein